MDTTSVRTSINIHFSEVLKFCPVCCSKKSSQFEEVDFNGIKLSNQICLRCGLVYLSPRMTGEETSAFYREQYRLFQSGAIAPSADVIQYEVKRADHLVGLLKAWLKKTPSRLLDVGASTGQILKLSRDSLGCKVVGIEPGDAYRNNVQENGFTVYDSIDNLINAREPRFDVVTMSHVLEHLPDPLGYLRSLKEQVVVPGGRLLIEVPNLYGHTSYEPGHLYSFTPKTIRNLLDSAGYEVDFFLEHSVPITYQPGWRYLTVLSTASPNVKSHLIANQLLVIPAVERMKRKIRRTDTRHIYGYLYSILRDRLFKISDKTSIT